MHEEQQESGEGQDAAPVDGTSVPPLQDEVVVEETIERTEVAPVEPTVVDDDEIEPDAEPQQESRETD